MRSCIFTLLLILSALCIAHAQDNLSQAETDSLWAVWSDTEKTDTARLEAIYTLSYFRYLDTDPDSAFYYAQMQYDLAESKGLKKHMASALDLQGTVYLNQGEYANALKYLLPCLKIDEELGNKVNLANSLNQIGQVYAQIAAYPKALEYFLRGLKLWEELGQNAGIAGTLNNIGILYGRQGDYDQALIYYNRSLKITEEIGDKKAVGGALINLGIAYDAKDDTVRAMEHYQRGLKICEEIGEKRFAANALSGIGGIYATRGNFLQAQDYFLRSLEIQKEIGAEGNSMANLYNLGMLNIKQKDYKAAIMWCEKGYSLSEQSGSVNRQKESCQCLYDAYKGLGNNNKAIVYLEKMGELDEQLQKEETVKKLQQMEFAKQVLADSIANAEKERVIQVAHEEEVRKKNNFRNVLIVLAAFILMVAGGIYSRLRFSRKTNKIITKEKDRSENLLLNILPADIAAELKEKGRTDARDFDMVSILFTDFKGFTEASAKLSAQDLVAEINSCFEAFDGIMEKYNIEKIKTIGDAYMAAGGLPVPSDDAVKNTVLAALEMQAFIQKRKLESEAVNKPAFEMRVGIHTGPVVAGIVGVKKFQYDIWGDTVNTASRMESSGGVGRVNISQATYELLRDDPQFAFEYRGKVEAKGKGEIEMYFVQLSMDSHAVG